MKNISILIFIILITVPTYNYCQDSSRIIILSNEVGLVVDSTERQEYEIFPNFRDNFISAVYYIGSDSQCYCAVKLKDEDSVKDSVLNLSYISIKNTAAKIQNLENKKRGNLDFNMNNVDLKFSNGEDLKNFVPGQIKTVVEKINPFTDLRKLPINKLNLDYSEIIEREFEVGLSAGILYNSAKYDRMGEIFNLLETNIPEAPYTISKTNFTFKSSPVFKFTGFIIYKNHIMSELVYLLNVHSKDYSNLNYKGASISIGYLFHYLKDLYPYFSLGYSASKFSIIKYYNAPINNLNGILESITVDGNAKGLKISIGILYNFTSNIGVNFYGDYKFYNKTQINQIYVLETQEIPDVKLNSFEIGLSFYIKK